MSASDVLHPGKIIKSQVIPKGMSVTKAAELVGVSRPTLSNLLNGNAALSPDMAMRLEKAFNYPRADLLDMQARYESAQVKGNTAPANTRVYVPPFLRITANDIERWASHNISARSRFAVFLRTLVHSTGLGLRKVDFPGNDDAERPGWDGQVDASEDAPWVPEGQTGWEFGTNEDPKTKANHDFDKSARGVPAADRTAITFVFVTPRRWPGKKSWEEEKRASGLWKDVRAFDASDLEQWIEQSLPGQVWFADETRMPSHGARSLDQCWADWANVANPPLVGSLFGPAIDDGKRVLLARLAKSAERPLVIAADSADEALAFVSQLLSDNASYELASLRDRVIVFDKPDLLPKLVLGATSFIPVVYTREVERELAPYTNSMHSIVIWPRNAANVNPDVILEPVSSSVIHEALAQMGKDRHEVALLERESGRSLTVLRRRLASTPAVRQPEWAADSVVAESLVPLMFVGAWNAKNEADQVAISLLSGKDYPITDKAISKLTQLSDAPVWAISSLRGLVSKIDVLFAVSRYVTTDDLKRYFDVAKLVLGEDDPSLDLADDERWMASLRGKTREFSGIFRKGVSETLVLLAAYGNDLFKDHLGVDVENEVNNVIRILLPAPLVTRTLEANDQDLPTYAEASPEEFLSVLESDLKSSNPAVLGLLRPVNPSVFGAHPSRTGLLWALEGLSWSPKTFVRAVLILARLAQVEIKDNWANKPINSLESIFRSWMPQTAASLDERIAAMNMLAKRFPDVAWKICIAQFGSFNDIGNYNHKPRWRADGYGFGEPFSTRAPGFAFVKEMVSMALAWPKHTLNTLSDLLERIHNLSPEHQAEVWALIEKWANDGVPENDKALLREKIRMSTLSRRAAVRARKLTGQEDLGEQARAAYQALEPTDLFAKHAWLFRDTWVEESADELDDVTSIDFRKREQRVETMRIEALREVNKVFGISGIIDLACNGRSASIIGALSAGSVLEADVLKDLVAQAFQRVRSGDEGAHSCRHLITGVLRALKMPIRHSMLAEMASTLTAPQYVELLLFAPYEKATWLLVDQLSSELQSTYWSEVVPEVLGTSDDEIVGGIERLMRANRPRAAFWCVRYKPGGIDAALLYRVLHSMARGGKDKPGEYMSDQYHLEEAFKHIDKSPVLSEEDKASLEFAYLGALAFRFDTNQGYGIPNLERHVEKHPELFVQAISWNYKRRDGGEDPTEIQIATAAQANAAELGYRLVDGLRRIPGHDDLDQLTKDRLARWVATVRTSCADISRGEVGDISIGKLLSYAPVGEDGVWPCEAVRDVIEDVQSDNIVLGARNGIYNARGAHWRGEGGDQERVLAEKYRRWGEALRFSHPYVSSKLLMGLVSTYEAEARREDAEADIRRRLE